MKARYEVHEVEYDFDYDTSDSPAGDLVRWPIEWAIYDRQTRNYHPGISYTSRSSAQTMCDIMNKED